MLRRSLLARAATLALALTVPLAAAAPAPAAPRDAAAIHAAALVFDPHEDLPAPYDFGPGWPDPKADDQVSAKLLRAGGVDAAGVAVFVPQGARTPAALAAARTQADAKLAYIQAWVAREPTLALARSAADVEAAARAGKTAIVPTILNAYALATPSDLASFAARGVRIIGLTHAGNNQYADSSRPVPRDTPGENGGLSDAGIALIGEANRLGVLVDVSQLSTPAFYQALAASRAPVIASHSGVRGLVDHVRNVSDDELAALKANGGVVGIVAFSAYLKPIPRENQRKIAEIRARYGAVNGYEGLSPEKRKAMSAETRALTPQATVADWVNAIDYAVKRIGIDHVAISTDFNHGGGVEGVRSAAELPAVTAELVRRGYSDEDIRKLWGGNVLRVLAEAERLAAAPATVTVR